MLGISFQMVGLCISLIWIGFILEKILKELQKKNKRDEMFDKANSDSRRSK